MYRYYRKNDNAYYLYKGEVITKWSYNGDTDSWDYLDVENGDYECELTSALQLNGTWESIVKTHVNDPSTYVIISNYDMNSFDICSEGFGTNTVHAQLEECEYLPEYNEVKVTFSGDGLSYSIGKSGNSGLLFEVIIYIRDDKVELVLDIEDPENSSLGSDAVYIAGY